MKLAELRNLVCLHIEASNEKNDLVTDSIIHGWSHEAATNNAFPKLRVIFLRNQPQITQSTFGHLNAFQSLEALCLSRNSSWENVLEGAYGWKKKR